MCWKVYKFRNNFFRGKYCESRQCLWCLKGDLNYNTLFHHSHSHLRAIVQTTDLPPILAASSHCNQHCDVICFAIRCFHYTRWLFIFHLQLFESKKRLRNNIRTLVFCIVYKGIIGVWARMYGIRVLQLEEFLTRATADDDSRIENRIEWSGRP